MEPSFWIGAAETEQFRCGVNDGTGQRQRLEPVGRDSGLVQQARLGAQYGAGVN